MKGKFKIELKKQVRTAIAASAGFVIAYAWRGFLLNVAQTIVNDLITLSPLTSSLLIAISFTLVGVLIILLSSRILE